MTDKPNPASELRGWQSMLAQMRNIAGRVTRGLTFGVQGAVLSGAGEILLVRHTYVAGWFLPGGGVEVGESAPSALERELLEEAGIRLTAAPELHGLFFHPELGRRDHIALYIVRDFSAGHCARPRLEIAEARFFPLDALPEGTTGGTRRRLAEIASGTAPAIHW